MTYDDMGSTTARSWMCSPWPASTGALVMVHAENHDIIGWLANRLEASAATPRRAHAISRPCWWSARRRTAP